MKRRKPGPIRPRTKEEIEQDNLFFKVGLAVILLVLIVDVLAFVLLDGSEREMCSRSHFSVSGPVARSACDTPTRALTK